MSKEKYKNQSVWMSYILRHGAIKEGFNIDKHGWVKVDELIARGQGFSHDVILEIVESDSKGRYSLSGDGQSIRANQGHSMDVDVGLKKAIPPVVLYHGTSMKAASEIKKKGIQKMSRQHVHLSADVTTASTVGRRHGLPVIFSVDCKAMLADGIDFYRSENGVWLVDFVDQKYFLASFVDDSHLGPIEPGATTFYQRPEDIRNINT